MARARNIKPGLFKNEVLGVADPLYTIVFEGLWVLADKEGRLEDRPLRIKAEVVPYRDGVNVDTILNWLQDNGFILRYEVGGKRYIVVSEFKKHQNPHKNEAESDIPSPEEIGTTSEKIGSTRADSLNSDSLNSDSLNLIPDSLPPASADAGDAEPAKKGKGGYPEDFEEAWTAYPSRPGASKADSFKAWKTRIKEGVDPQALIDGVKRYAAYCLACETEPGYIKQPATFLGPGQHYLSDWTPPARASPQAVPNKHAAAARAIFGAPSPDFIDV